jgi:hypothetical protein
MIRPSGEWPVSCGSSGHSQVWSVTSKTLPRRFDATSSGQTIRKLRSFSFSVGEVAAGRLQRRADVSTGVRDVDRVVSHLREVELLAQHAAVDVRVGAHP